MINQTEGQKAQEHAAISQLAVAWGCDCFFTKELYTVDGYLLSEGQVVAAVEHKDRSASGAFGVYPDVIVSAEKWGKAIPHAEALGVQLLFLTEWTDGMYIHRHTKGDVWPIRVGGACAREPELVCHIPVSAFSQVVTVGELARSNPPLISGWQAA